MTKHSPTPFSVEYSPHAGQDGKEVPSFRIYDAEGQVVAETDSDKSRDQQEVDAALLGAAGDMLDALEVAVEHLEIGNYAGEEDECIALVNAAITRAKQTK